jgi:tetratricopeptide (TPR) repeat protein
MVAQEQRQWAQAERHYQQALVIQIGFGDRYEQAKTYHQLGIVAQEQRQWAQAERHLQQALEIKIEFNDRYAQASTYHQLGRVAQEQRQWAQARQYLLMDLEISAKFGDEHDLGITLRSLARLWQASSDAGLPGAMASILKMAPGEVEDLLRRLLAGDEGQGTPEGD